MKITTFIMITVILHVSAASVAQKITLKEKNAPLVTIFEQISAQTGYDFAFTTDALKDTKPVTINVTNEELNSVLTQIFQGQNLDFSLDNKTVVIKPKEYSFLEKLKNAISLIDAHGHVLDEQGKPIPGATVQTKDHKQVTISSANGEFTLKGVNEGTMIMITFLGYQPKEVNAAIELGNISMVQSTSKLDEVQVQAYGQTSRRLSISNIGTVKAAEIAQQPVTNPLLALEGKVPGLVVTQSTGYANSGVTVRIQGQNSIANGNNPLYVIDGVPYISELLNSGFTSNLGTSGGTSTAVYSPYNGGGNPLSFINPGDIESIDILKDADATAIYGSRAGNGAILITTKKGKAGATKVDGSVQNGWGQVGHFLPLMNTQQYLAMRKEALKNDGLALPTSSTAPSGSNYDFTLWDQNRYTDWQKVLIGGTAKYTNAQASVSGGSGNTSFLVGAGYNHQTTVFPGDQGDTKGSLHFNINHASANQKFKIQWSGSYQVDYNKMANVDLTAVAERLPPNAPALYNPDGSLNWAPVLNPDGTPKLDILGRQTSTWYNPLTFLDQTNKNQTNNLLLNTTLSYELLPGLNLRSNFGYTNLTQDEFVGGPLSQFAPENRPYNLSSSSFSKSYITTYIIEPQITYKRALGKGILEALAGGTVQRNINNLQSIQGKGYQSDALLENIGAATTILANNTYTSEYRYNALFGRLSYNWEDRYLINLTARRDGSSRFGADNEFHNFGSVGAAWIFSNESFVKDHLGFLSFGKLRGSYGTTGNDQIGDYQFLNLYNSIPSDNIFTPYQGVTGLTPAGLPNPHLAWETINKLQGGIDLGFFKDRLLLNATYFRNRSSNQLLGYNLPRLTGYASVIANFPATIQNSGWELSFNTINVQGTNFRWSTSFNLTLPENKLIAFPNLAASSYFDALIVGQPITISKYFHSLGVDPATGLYIEQGAKGPTSTPNLSTDRTVHIDLLPKFTGGFQNSFSYKALTLDVLVQFAKQRKLDYSKGFQPGQFASQPASSTGAVIGNQPIWVLQRWQQAGDNASVQKFSNYLYPFTFPGYQAFLAYAYSVTASDASIGDASYLRLKNVSLSWTLPQTVQKKLHLQNARIFALGQNLLTITHYKGTDPETGSSNSLPPLRVITIGLQLGL